MERNFYLYAISNTHTRDLGVLGDFDAFIKRNFVRKAVVTSNKGSLSIVLKDASGKTIEQELKEDIGFVLMQYYCCCTHMHHTNVKSSILIL